MFTVFLEFFFCLYYDHCLFGISIWGVVKEEERREEYRIPTIDFLTMRWGGVGGGGRR